MGNQGKRIFAISDMSGIRERDVYNPNFVFLSSDFLKTKLNATFSDFARQNELIGRETDIACPLCGQGIFRLVLVYLLTSFTLNKERIPIGVHYEFICSNIKSCEGKFMGAAIFVHK